MDTDDSDLIHLFQNPAHDISGMCELGLAPGLVSVVKPWDAGQQGGLNGRLGSWLGGVLRQGGRGL